MSRLPYKVATLRGANMFIANAKSLGSPKDARWATGRTVKGEAPGGGYRPVEVWTLKRRDADGKVEVVDTLRSEEDAKVWVADGTY